MCKNPLFCRGKSKFSKISYILFFSAIISTIGAGILWASNFFETDSDGDGWADEVELVMGTNPFDREDPWDSDGDGIPDYLEFAMGTDPLDPKDPQQKTRVGANYSSDLPPPIQLVSDDDPPVAASGMPTWKEPEPDRDFDADGTGTVSYEFSSSGGTKTGPGGEETYEFNIPKGNIISIVVSADDSATVEVEDAEISATSNWDPVEKKIISGEATSNFIDINDFAGESFPVSVSYKNEGGPYVLSFTVSSRRVKAEISKVNISATSKIALIQDNGSPFGGADWEKGRSRDNKSRESNPISVTSGEELKFVPIFKVLGGMTPTQVKAEFTIPGKDKVSVVKSYSAINSGFQISAPVPAGNIDYFDNSLTVEWFVQYAESSKWISAGTSAHEIYFTRATPTTEFKQETLFHVSCTGGKGKTTEADVVDGIYSIFQSRAVKRKSDQKVMTYWAKNEAGEWQMGEQETHKLLAARDGNGNCQAWSAFFRDTIKVQGIGASRICVTSKNEISSILGTTREGLLVREWVFIQDKDATADFQNFTHKGSAEFAPGNILPGQGNQQTPPQFNLHYIVKADANYYDPSYGTGKKTTSDGGLAYEYSAFCGYFFDYYYSNRDRVRYGRKNEKKILDVNYTEM